MTITGTVVNGTVVPDGGVNLPEGARMVMALADEVENWPDLQDDTLPPDHPMAPYNREVEIAILKESIAETQAGYPGRPFAAPMRTSPARHD
jgi:hypothetical protein